MVVDTSVLVAILKNEPEAVAFIDRIESVADSCISAGSLLECGVVIGSRAGRAGLLAVQELCNRLMLEIVPVNAVQSVTGAQAFLRFGRGSGHPAKLNFGDCFAYALAKERNRPLLFMGDYFIHTDIEPALRTV